MPLHPRRQRPATQHQRASTFSSSASASSSDEPETRRGPQQEEELLDDSPEQKRDFQPPASHVASTPISTQRQQQQRQRREIAPRRDTDSATASQRRHAGRDDARDAAAAAAAYGEQDWQPFERQPQEFMYLSSPPSYHPPPTPRTMQSQAPGSHIRSRMSGPPQPPREFHPDVSFGTDLDYLPPVNDEIGPDVAETFNLGSFGEDSPPRGSTPHRRSSPRPSPPRYHYQQHPGYSPYAPRGAGAPPPPHQQGQRPYAAATASSYPSYYPPHPSQASTSSSLYGGGPPDHPQSMPPHYGASYPPHYYYYPPTPHYPHQLAMHPPPQQEVPPWSSPEAFHVPPPMAAAAAMAPSRTPEDDDDDDDDLDRKYPAAATSPPHKKKRRDRRSSPSPRREMIGNTPEKLKDSDELKMEEDEHGRLIMRSPFRSPPPSATSQKFKKFFHTSPPAIGTMGSFGLMGTPGGLGVSEFSPMGQHTPFGASHSLDEPLPIGAGDFPTRLPLARSEDDDDDEEKDEEREEEEEEQQQQPAPTPMLTQRRLSSGGSGGSAGFVRDFSPLGGGMQVSRSPLRSERRSRESASSTYDVSGILSPPQPESRSSLPIRSSAGSMPTRLLTSPMGHTRSSAKPRKLWQEPGAPTPGPVRLELGDVVGPSERQRTLEGINIMMRASSTKHPPSLPAGVPAAPPYSASRTSAPAPGRFLHAPPPPPYREPIRTQSHRGPPHATSASSASRRLVSRQQSFPQPPPSTATKPSPGPTYASLAPRSTPSMAGTTPGTARPTPSSGKENTMASPATASKRKPCNCKKSKCLKLYCECFAAELYCESCNCSECHNIASYEPARSKAIKDIRSKNPNAFKPRINAKPSPVEGPTPQSGHNMGCRCKRSECLKKYCECFQAGVICGPKCKCVECLNYAGSQALIDKRRKIKDHRGADFAMRVADEAWKGKSSTPRNPSLPAVRGMGVMPSPTGRGAYPPSLPPAMMQRSSPTGTRGPHPQGQPPLPHYMPHHMMMGPPHAMGYSPMGVPAVTPGYQGSLPLPPQHLSQDPHRAPTLVRQPPPRLLPPPPPPPLGPSTSATTASSVKRAPQVTPGAFATPRTPATRIGFDARRRRSNITLPEPTLDYFGSSVPEQPKTTALAVFSFLGNDDLYNASLVCHLWSRLALDEELWQFQA